jgi:hypothetical protein
MLRGRPPWLLGWLGVLAALAQTQAQAQDSDWLAEFPTVTAVAHAAFAELAVTAKRGNVSLTSDDDSIAVNLAGTFVVLRQILVLKGNAEPDMSIERASKLRQLLAAYEEAELTIGQGATGRVGYIKRGPPTGMGCGGDMECYRRWFQLHLNASSGRAEYRERLLRRLFPCGPLAKELDELRQAHATTVPYTPSPATTLRVDRKLEGLGPAGCDAYGGDAGQNGLCDDWEHVPARVQSGSSLAASPNDARCAVLTRVRSEDGGGLEVSIAKGTAAPDQQLRLRIVRAAEPPTGEYTGLVSCGTGTATSGPCVLWAGDAQIRAGTAGSLYATIARGARLEPGASETRPVLVVQAESARSRKPVHCEQPLPTWLPRQKAVPSGLHGPYDDIEQALLNDVAGTLALQSTGSGTELSVFTDRAEHGYLIVRDSRVGDRLSAKSGYYTTPPLHSSSQSVVQPLFLPEDYYRSFQRAFAGSCEDPANFEVVATVHTHPEQLGAPDNFSADDFNQAIGFLVWQDYQFGLGNLLSAKLEKIALITKSDGLIRTFAPAPGDEPIAWWELRWLSDAYTRYTDRVTEIGKPPPP